MSLAKNSVKTFDLAILRPSKDFIFSMVLMNSADVNTKFIKRITTECERVIFCDGAVVKFHSLFAHLPIEKHWVGDFDSSDRYQVFKDVSVHHNEDQNKNDLEKSLYLLERLMQNDRIKKQSQKLASSVIIDGITGGRFDHQM